MTGEKYDEAISAFEEASALKPNEAYPKKQIKRRESYLTQKQIKLHNKRNTMILFQKELENLVVKIGSQQNPLSKKL